MKLYNRSATMTSVEIPYGSLGYGKSQGPFGKGQAGQRIINRIINQTFLDDQDKITDWQRNHADDFRGF